MLYTSSQTARGTPEWHEGWRHTSPGHHRQDTPCCCAAANVREEHPQPIGQPGPRGHRSEPITDLTTDAGAALTSHLARFTLTDWGQRSPHRHVADVLPLNHHVQHSQVSPPRSAPTTHLRTQKSIRCAAELWFEKTGTVDVGWEWMEESLLPVADFRQIHWDSDLTPVTWALSNCGKLHWPVLVCLYSRVKRVYVIICNMKLKKLDRRRSSMFGVYWCFVVIFWIIKEFKGFYCAHFHL